MLRESQVAVVVRNDRWAGTVSTEPYEAGWASEAILFIRALDNAEGPAGKARVEISPDGMRWVAEGTTFPLPVRADQVTFARVAHFGNWLRVTAELPQGAAVTVLVTYHLKG